MAGRVGADPGWVTIRSKYRYWVVPDTPTWLNR